MKEIICVISVYMLLTQDVYMLLTQDVLCFGIVNFYITIMSPKAKIQGANSEKFTPRKNGLLYGSILCC